MRVAGEVGVSETALGVFERGVRTPPTLDLARLRRTLESAGVIFVEENGEGLPGMRLSKGRAQLMVWCEIRDDGGGSVNAQFEIVPRVGEEIVILADVETSVTAVVKKVTHISLDVHGNDSRPTIQLLVEKAD